MDFTYEELARLNTMMGIALMSGEVECDEISESVHKRITDEIVRRNQTEGKEVMKNVDSEKKMGITRKRIDDLEKKVQDQNEILHSHMLKHETENAELKEIIDSFEKEIIKECNTHYRTNVQDL